MREVFIVDGARTPFVKAKPIRNPLSASDLAVAAGKPLLARQFLNAVQLDEVVIGCVAPAAEETNIGRIIALRLGCGPRVMGWTVQRNCASGLQALDSAFKDIALGRHDLVLAGGTEAMSRTPLLFGDAMVDWLGRLNSAKTPLQKLQTIGRWRPIFLKPVIALLKGLTDPVVGLSMGQTAEILAHRFEITRKEMDEFSVQSHLRALQAYDQGYMKEVEPLFDWKGGVVEVDDGIRPDSSVMKLAKLKPVFDKPFGQVTAGNSSQVSDGAALLLLASEAGLKKHRLKPLAKIKDVAWAALDPSIMGLGPVHAIAELLKNNKLLLSDIDYFEINEAFAAQVLACQKAMQDSSYCQESLGWSKPLGTLSSDQLNVDGGAVAIGHPVGASGARLVLHMMHLLKRTETLRGIATLCIGGGQGGAVLLENVREQK